MKDNTKNIVRAALLFACAVVLSLLEGMLPPIPGLYGIRLGLSNVAVMAVLFTVGKGYGFGVAVLKAGFVFLVRGAAAGLLSLAGGILSVGVMALLLALSRNRASCLALSVSGGVAHNLGQLAAVTLLYSQPALLSLTPILLIAGAVAGSATAVLLRILSGYLSRPDRM